MARTTSELVGGIIEVDDSISLEPFIATATSLVDRIATPSELSASDLELVERWLSAHFYAMRDPRPTSEKAGPVAEDYQSAVALGLNASHYGQQAMLLDTSGTLRRLSRGISKAKVTWLGTTSE